MSNKTSNRTIYVPPDEYEEWRRIARVESAARNQTVSVSNLIRGAMEFALGHADFVTQQRDKTSAWEALGGTPPRPFA